MSDWNFGKPQVWRPRLLDMARIFFTRCYSRDETGVMIERNPPAGEPDPYGVPFSLYWPSYRTKGGFWGPPRVLESLVLIYNTRNYQRDVELEEFVRDRVLEEIRSRWHPQVILASGGPDAIRESIVFERFWRIPKQ